MDGVSKILHDAPRQPCGVGYVIIGRGQDMATYISSSFRNNRISIITDQGEVIAGCIVARNAWQYLEFPTTIKGRGSEVVWVNIPYQNRVVIFDILHKRDELNPIQSPNQFKFQRRVGENVVTIQGDGQTGTINIVSQGNNNQEGEIYIKVLNESELALFNVYVQGKMLVDIEGDLNFRLGNSVVFTVRNEENPNTEAVMSYIIGQGYSLLDEFKNNVFTNQNGVFNEVPSGAKVYARAIGAVSQPGLLGNNTLKLLNDIKNLLTDVATTLLVASTGSEVSGPPILAKTITWNENIATIASDIQNIIAQNFELS